MKRLFLFVANSTLELADYLDRRSQKGEENIPCFWLALWERVFTKFPDHWFA